MLVLTMKLSNTEKGEHIVVTPENGDPIKFYITQVKGKQVRVGIVADRNSKIDRENANGEIVRPKR